MPILDTPEIWFSGAIWQSLIDPTCGSDGESPYQTVIQIVRFFQQQCKKTIRFKSSHQIRKKCWMFLFGLSIPKLKSSLATVFYHHRRQSRLRGFGVATAGWLGGQGQATKRCTPVKATGNFAQLFWEDVFYSEQRRKPTLKDFQSFHWSWCFF